MKRILTVIAILIFTVGVANAKYIQTCKVKYKKDYGWSDYYTVEVTFMSGTELNKATTSYDYDSYSTYGIVFWGEGEASVIKISSYTGCLTEIKQNCITNKVTNMEGEDQQGRGWEICTKNYCY